MKIMMLNYEFPPIGGGTGQEHLAILKQLAGRKDLLADVVTSSPTPGLAVEKLSDNITIYKVGVHKKNLHYWRKIEVVEWLFMAGRPYRQLLAQNRYDLVHIFSAMPTGFLCRKDLDKTPYIISLCGSDVPGQHNRLQLEYKLTASLSRRLWTKASAIVSLSDGLKKRAIEFVPSVNIDIISNGVDLSRFYPVPNKVLSGEFKLLTVGRLSATKRIDMLIEAVEILNKQGRSFRLTIAGGGKLQPELEGLIKQKGLGNIVRLPGRIDPQQMPEVYREHDMFVSASYQEGMSNAMVESIASGLPIITTRCEGVEELIGDNGIIVEDASADALAEAIIKLADNQQQYKAMCAAARRRAGKFSWQTVAEEYINLYHRVIGKK
ncbi:MAG: glycosyltransferase family 4 protein [Sedimentisphaerales bacterium]|jgi:glycosyltransferase involved in cell wall biosynthesis